MARARAQLCHSSGRRRLAAAAAPRTAQAPSGSPAPQGPRLPHCGRVPGATVTGTPALRGPAGAAHLEDVLTGQTENATPLRNHAQAAGTPHGGPGPRAPPCVGSGSRREAHFQCRISRWSGCRGSSPGPWRPAVTEADRQDGAGGGIRTTVPRRPGPSRWPAATGTDLCVLGCLCPPIYASLDVL